MTQQLEQLTKRPGTGTFIRDHLSSVLEDYVYNSYKAFCQSLKKVGQRCPTYNSFRVYWCVCVEMDLLQFVHEEPSEFGQPRRYYRLVQKNVNSPVWNNPRASLDLRKGHTVPDPLTGKPIPISRLGRRRYSRRVLGVPPKRVGRPRKPKPIRGAAAVATDATRT